MMLKFGCSWQWQLEKNEKLEIFQVENFCLSWKESIEVSLKLENLNELEKLSLSNRNK